MSRNRGPAFASCTPPLVFFLCHALTGSRTGEQKRKPMRTTAGTSGVRRQVRRARLVILATSDLHANLRPYNYYLDEDGGDPGLARAATLVRRIRAQEPNCLLFDNGDTLQGSPLGDLAVEGGTGFPHPMIAAMNALGYDGATVGNHDFNYGLEFLDRCLRDARFPVVLANLDHAGGGSLLPRSALLDRELLTEDGGRQTLRIGVIGLAPPQITKWDSALLAGRVKTAPIVERARQEATRLRAGGAELVVALCHSGLGAAQDAPDLENALLPLAASGAVDVIVAGHTHKTLPSDAHPGPIHGVPVVQPGFFGSHLGQITLGLEHDGRWRVTQSEAGLHPLSDLPADPALMSLSATAHEATLAHVRSPIGESDRPLETYFSLAADCPSLALIAEAARVHAARALEGHPLAHLPLLSAAAPFKAGGRAGPGYYTDIPAGPLSIRHAADLYGYPNALHVLHATGADLRDWLERAASAFNRIEPDRPAQHLLDPGFSSYNFDVIFGLGYRIDLSQPALYSADGEQVFPGPGRIRDLVHEGRPVQADEAFLIVTNSYRAAGGGHFLAPTRCPPVLACQDTVRDVLVRHIRDCSPLSPRAEPVWSFCPMPGTSVILETGPGAMAHPARIAELGLTPLDRDSAGFQRFLMPL